MIEIANKTKHPLPRVSFDFIHKKILGSKYNLSLVFMGNTLGRKLNKQYRDKTYSPNVLSFSLGENSGEIFINHKIAEKQHQKFAMTRTQYVGFLFIHACLHLKGYQHGDTMEDKEKLIFNSIFINGSNHRMRNRHRNKSR